MIYDTYAFVHVFEITGFMNWKYASFGGYYYYYYYDIYIYIYIYILFFFFTFLQNFTMESRF